MISRKTIIGAAVLLVFGMASSASAWDGQRKGFILGIGIGIGGVTDIQTVDGEDLLRRYTGAGVSNAKIGGAFNNRFLLYFCSMDSWFRTIDYEGDSVLVRTDLAAVGASYYLKPEFPSYYLSGALGTVTWNYPWDRAMSFDEEDGEDVWRGIGILVGGGYEFRKYFSVEANLKWEAVWGEYEGDPARARALTLGVAVNVLGY